MKTTKLILAGLTSIALATACNKQEDATNSSNTETPPKDNPSTLEAIFLSTEPKAPMTVLEARANAEPGQPITVVGSIGATISPFTEGYATFVLGDDSLDFCTELPGDHCATPWDACCEPSNQIADSRLSIQILDDDGKPFPRSLKGVQGLKELDQVVVTGTVAETSTPENLLINATGIFKRTL
ncbi:MAG: hypothetical protein AAGD22_14850 [Verrucomicrobiota bacterium]